MTDNSSEPPRNRESQAQQGDQAESTHPLGESPSRGPWWKWWVCGLLLLATTINYMDRQTLSSTATRITTEFDLSNEQYGNIETCFSLAFAAGATLFGVIADRTSVRWLYPAVLLLWSGMGFCTGFVHTYAGLLICRGLLGLFEAGHWPCALKTTQRILSPQDRTLGNSILQSGTSIGAIATPLLMTVLLTPEPGSWRGVFQAIGATGVVWIALWLLSVNRHDLAPLAAATPDATGDDAGENFWSVVFSRRFVVLLIVVSLINICWHLFRVWLPKFLMEGRSYTEAEALGLTSLYYVATDAGCIAAGAASLWLHRRGLSVRLSRLTIFTCCAALSALSTVLALLPAGPALVGVLLLIGFGNLGLFPCYYSFSQQLSVKHQGKVTGLLGTFAWMSAAPVHPYFGRVVDQTRSFDLGIGLVGWAPMAAALVLWLLWHEAEPRPAR